VVYVELEDAGAALLPTALLLEHVELAADLMARVLVLLAGDS
jgi:hypothetical protein